MKKFIVLPLLALSLVACASSSSSKTDDAPVAEAAEAAAETVEAAATEVADAAPAPAAGDIVDIAAGNPDFSTLVAAVQAAGLVDTLKSDGPFTVFAPTNDAFAKLPEGTVEALLQDKEKLTAILTYHVVSGAVMASDVAGMTSATTVQGGALAIDTADGVKVGSATVVQADIVAKNGVIHVIDTVLIPEG